MDWIASNASGSLCDLDSDQHYIVAVGSDVTMLHSGGDFVTSLGTASVQAVAVYLQTEDIRLARCITRIASFEKG
ncbi:hypothetical protein SASPL_157438 [Salvia splendens]|uniref:Uncharacterized protein n=1 Tax=Salvia splendens TaxID=180675 RepID=A0A8X8YV07_SALSN|nr:hypothetical protein SASPL_157438 [Salvia splendens]